MDGRTDGQMARSFSSDRAGHESLIDAATTSRWARDTRVAVAVQAFDDQPHLQLLKEMLTQIFATPKKHHKVKPFLDHVVSFHVSDSRIWIRNYQV
jgi:Brix domain